MNKNKKPDTPHYWLTAVACLLAIAVLLAPLAHAASETLAVVKGNKFLRCGIGENVPGFSEKVPSGGYRGFNVDFCRAVAVLGDPDKVTYTPVSAAGRFPLLLSGRIELLSHATTWNLAREGGIRLTFPGIYFYDGQGVMVPHASDVRRIEDLKDATSRFSGSTTAC